MIYGAYDTFPIPFNNNSIISTEANMITVKVGALAPAENYGTLRGKYEDREWGWVLCRFVLWEKDLPTVGKRRVVMLRLGSEGLKGLPPVGKRRLVKAGLDHGLCLRLVKYWQEVKTNLAGRASKKSRPKERPIQDH